MRSSPRFTWVFGCLGLISPIRNATAPVLANVVTYEGNVFPEEEGWERGTFCTPERWLDDGWLHQELDISECIPPPDGDMDSYTRSIQEYNVVVHRFLDFQVSTTGDRSEIPGGAPTVVVAFNFFDVIYHVTVAMDKVKLARDLDLPILFFDLKPGVTHAIRFQIDNNLPETYRWYIDGQVVDEGLAEWAFPAHDSRVSWRGKAWYLPCENQWDFIRFGITPVDGSGDYNSDGQVDSVDFYFFEECISNGGPGVDAGPGCRFADFDADRDVDCTDWGAFKVAWTGPGNPLLLLGCDVPFDAAIPTISEWGLAVMTLLLVTTATIVFGPSPPPRCETFYCRPNRLPHR